jgi:hypothetical protein
MEIAETKLAVDQILNEERERPTIGYKDIANEWVKRYSGRVRGILVCSDFDARAKAAARMVPNLILRRYSVRFLFSDGHT